MCGICGYLALDRERPVERGLLERMNNTLLHRGPDSEGYYIEGNLGLAMRRLAIIDVEGGRQPIMNEDGTVVVVFNGEIYNFRELRAELLQCGHRFATKSDTEVIVHAYEQWGDNALERLNGMFAIALWDERRQRLLLARDRMGQKPLYWHSSSHGLLWASEAKALLQVPWVDRRVNPLALHHYLTLQYVPDPLTIFQGISRLPAAHKLIVERDGVPRVSRWWQLNFSPKLRITDQEATAQARQLLAAGVRRHLISDVPLGAFLSGGIDSSIIVALMAEQTSHPVRTFSIGFEEKHFSEAAYALEVSQRYRTDHHEFIFRPMDLQQTILGVLKATDEPFADPAALPLYELARQTRNHVTVVLSGDGGDETMAGYARYVLDGLLRFAPRIAGKVSQRFLSQSVAWLREPDWLPEDRNAVAGVKRLPQILSVTPKASLVRWGSYFSHDQKIALYADRWRDELIPTDTADVIAAAYDESAGQNLLDGTLYADQATYLAGDLLPKTDRVTMAHSLEARAPFLDADWVRWSARLPGRFKVRGLTTKWLLRAAFGDKLPHSTVARSKQGFSIPIGAWLRGDLYPWATGYLSGNHSLDEWFRPPAVQRLLAEHHRGKINHGKRLWALLMFAVWLEHCLPQSK